MSMNMAFDEDRSYRIASSQGWRDVNNWVRTLPISEFKYLTHLIYHGYEKNVRGVYLDIQQSVKRYTPKSKTVIATLANMLTLLQRNEPSSQIVIITNGLTPVKTP